MELALQASDRLESGRQCWKALGLGGQCFYSLSQADTELAFSWWFVPLLAESYRALSAGFKGPNSLSSLESCTFCFESLSSNSAWCNDRYAPCYWSWSLCRPKASRHGLVSRARRSCKQKYSWFDRHTDLFRAYFLGFVCLTPSHW